MSLVRVHEVAKAHGISSKDVIAYLAVRGHFVKSASSTVPAEAVAAVLEKWPPLGAIEPAVESDHVSLRTLGESAPGNETASDPSYPRWIVKAQTRDGRIGYYGESHLRNVGVIEYRGNAYRYSTRNEALGAAYNARDLRIFTDFALELLPPKARFKTPGVDKEGNG